MKHIKKKFAFDEPIAEKLKVSGEFFPLEETSRIKQKNGSELYLTLNDNHAVRCFMYKKSSDKLIIPIPELPLIYFDSAYRLNKSRIQDYINFKKQYQVSNLPKQEAAINQLYNYYGLAASTIISLFTSIESFINESIPKDGKFINEASNKTEIYNRDQIQRHLSFKTKIDEVIPSFFEGRNFYKNKTVHTQHLDNLKNLRDDIIHPKSESDFKHHENLIKRLLSFNYEDTLKAVATYMNFYRPDYIVECDCGLEY